MFSQIQFQESIAAKLVAAWVGGGRNSAAVAGRVRRAAIVRLEKMGYPHSMAHKIVWDADDMAELKIDCEYRYAR